MVPIVFVMALMGCGEGDAPCREVRLDGIQYRSEAACRAQTETVLLRNSDLSFPTVVARCRPAGARPQPLSARDVRLPPPDARLARLRFAAR